MSQTLTNTEDLALIRADLQHKPWLVACLCAAWCNTCGDYRVAFDALRLQHPDKCFAWLDIEEQAHLVDEVDVENFPTVLIQHDDAVLFFGTMLPDARQLHRLILSLSENAAPPAANGKLFNQGTPPNWSLRRLLMETA
ncbi:thioredoxin domain-containing protein [Undibacterium sp.]|jgi:thioredoxin 1|uniref:thioredoxin domain-containing protein n=1 Tax=Undibacterium sp. TaxID=1914977 RepID=UPI002B8D58B8|nr:thioredoxin domain-containing protein [Undibacterium sp.]HTD03548.1 thioredoxin domain-containing protein [Undibacterium sp.]